MSSGIIRVGATTYAVPTSDALDDVEERIIEAARAGAAMVDLPPADGRDRSILITAHQTVTIERFDASPDHRDLGEITSEINDALRAFDY